MAGKEKTFMKPIQINDDDHKWLLEEKERTGVSLVNLIKFMVADRKEKSDNGKTTETAVLPILPE